MKQMVFCIVIVVAFLISPVSATVICSVKHANQADLKVFIVNHESEADLKVYQDEHANKAQKNDGIWFFAKHPNQAKKRILFVNHAYQADLKIYFVKHPYQAGWKNKSKQHLLM